jgi:hypothetical protein
VGRTIGEKLDGTPLSPPSLVAGKVIPEQKQADAVTKEAGKNPAAVALGKLGGAKGGKARAQSLTPKRRSVIAKKAAEARWKAKRRD